MAEFALRPADEGEAQRRAGVEMRLQPLEPLGVEHGEPRAGIGEDEFELGASAPGVERHGDGAGEDRSEEGDRPFRQVAHPDRDAVALGDAERLQLMGENHRRPREGLESGALALVDEESPAGEGAARDEDVAQRLRGVLPNPRLPAPDFRLGDLERRARRGEPGVRLGERHGGVGQGLPPASYDEVETRRGEAWQAATSAPAVGAN